MAGTPRATEIAQHLADSVPPITRESDCPGSCSIYLERDLFLESKDSAQGNNFFNYFRKLFAKNEGIECSG